MDTVFPLFSTMTSFLLGLTKETEKWVLRSVLPVVAATASASNAFFP